MGLLIRFGMARISAAVGGVAAPQLAYLGTSNVLP